MLKWLADKNVELEDRFYKVDELWSIITPMIETADVYNAERIMQKYNVRCLRLPPYHPEFNPSKCNRVRLPLEEYVQVRSMFDSVR